MLRRSLLTAAVAAPALYASRASALIYSDEDLGAGETSWLGDPGLEWNVIRSSWAILHGKKLLPPGTTYVSGPSDPWFRTQLKEGEYADFGNLVELMVFGSIVGTEVGSWFKNPLLGGRIGAGVGGLMWIGYNGGVFLHNLGPGNYTPTGSPVVYNGQYFSPQAMATLTAPPTIGNGICVPSDDLLQF